MSLRPFFAQIFQQLLKKASGEFVNKIVSAGQLNIEISHARVENPYIFPKSIAKIIGCSKGTVIRTLKKYLILDTISRKPGSGNKQQEAQEECFGKN